MTSERAGSRPLRISQAGTGPTSSSILQGTTRPRWNTPNTYRYTIAGDSGWSRRTARLTARHKPQTTAAAKGAAGSL